MIYVFKKNALDWIDFPWNMMIQSVYKKAILIFSLIDLNKSSVIIVDFFVAITVIMTFLTLVVCPICCSWLIWKMPMSYKSFFENVWQVLKRKNALCITGKCARYQHFKILGIESNKSWWGIKFGTSRYMKKKLAFEWYSWKTSPHIQVGANPVLVPKYIPYIQ